MGRIRAPHGTPSGHAILPIVSIDLISPPSALAAASRPATRTRSLQMRCGQVNGVAHCERHGSNGVAILHRMAASVALESHGIPTISKSAPRDPDSQSPVVTLRIERAKYQFGTRDESSTTRHCSGTVPSPRHGGAPSHAQLRRPESSTFSATASGLPATSTSRSVGDFGNALARS